MVSGLAASILPSALFSALLLWAPVASVEVRFFYSPLKDSCAWGGTNTFPATNLTANGGVCAFVPSRNRLFACPAPNDVCWGFNVNCQGGTSQTAGPNQILCGRSNGQQWCCGDNESCTTAPGQINVCIPNDFKNPLAGVSADDAREAEFSALPSESIVTSLPRSTPSAFSTLSPTSSSSSRSTTTARPNSSSSSAGGTVDSGNANAGSSSSTSDDGGSGISGGAIAGIVIGAIIGTLLIVAAVLLLLRRRKRNQTALGPDGGLYEKPHEDWNTQYAPSTAEGTVVGGPQSQQYGGYYAGEVYAKEAPDSVYPTQEPPQEPPQEMPAHVKPQELP